MCKVNVIHTRLQEMLHESKTTSHRGPFGFFKVDEAERPKEATRRLANGSTGDSGARTGCYVQKIKSILAKCGDSR
jgi:hypothetical protein